MAACARSAHYCLVALVLAAAGPGPAADAEIVHSKPKAEGAEPVHPAPARDPKIDILPGYDRSPGEVSNGSGEALMLGGTMPKVVDIQDLPEPDSSKAQLLNRLCAQCHGLPSPDQHSAEGWLPVVSRMKARMRWMTMYSNIKIVEPNANELRQISDYLQEYARKPDGTPP